MRRLALCLLLGLAGPSCLDAGRAVDWPTEDLSFLVSFDAQSNAPDSPTEILGPFFSAPEAFTFARSDSTRSFLVVFHQLDIQTVRRPADLSDPESLELSFSEWEPSCERGERLDDGRLRFGARRFGEIFELVDGAFMTLEPEASEILDRATLSTPETSDACRLDGSLLPFGDRPELLADNPTVGNRNSSADEDATVLEDLALIDQDHLVARSKLYLFSFERGRPFVDQPGQIIAAADLLPDSEISRSEYGGMVSFVDAGESRFAVLAMRKGDLSGSRVDVYRHDGSGIERVATSSFAQSYELLVSDGEWLYALDEDGGDSPRPIMIASRPEGPFIESTLLPFDIDIPPAVGPKHTLFLVESATQEVHRFDPESAEINRLAAQPESTAPFSGLESQNILYDRDADELVLTLEREGARGAFDHVYTRYSFATEEWRLIDLELGTEALACGSSRPPCGQIRASGYLKKPSSTADGPFALIDACRAVVDLTPRVGCESAIYQSAELPIAHDPRHEWESLVVEPDRLVVGGSRGLLLELSR